MHDRTCAYLTVHADSAREVRHETHSPVTVCGPLVAPGFEPNPGRRRRARRSLGIVERSVVALVVAGAWGVGEIEATTADLEGIGGCTVVVVCGHNRRLAARLRERVKPGTRVLGFVDTMPELMNAADVLVGNAGGQTAMEAFRSDLPVVSYRPIPADGTDNVRAMSTAGVATLAHDRAELAEAVRGLGNSGPRRDAQIQAGRAIFPADATDRILRSLDLDARPRRRDAGSEVMSAT